MRILLKNIKETKEMICEKYSRFPKQRVCFWNVLQKRFVFFKVLGEPTGMETFKYL
jgi:hypothetical protein